MQKFKALDKRIKIAIAIIGILVFGGACYFAGFITGHVTIPPKVAAGVNEQLTGTIIGIDADKIKIKDHDTETLVIINPETTIIGRQTKLALNQSVSIHSSKVGDDHIAIQVRIR